MIFLNIGYGYPYFLNFFSTHAITRVKKNEQYYFFCFYSPEMKNNCKLFENVLNVQIFLRDAKTTMSIFKTHTIKEDS
jgi:hypothetical protein